MQEEICGHIPWEGLCQEDIAEGRCPGMIDCNCHTQQSLQQRQNADVKSAVMMLQFQRAINGPRPLDIVI